MSKLEGTNLETLWETMPHNNKVIILRELGEFIREVHAYPPMGFKQLIAIGHNFLKNK